MTAPVHVRIWSHARTHAPAVETAGNGKWIVLMKKSPDRADDAACEDGAATVSWGKECSAFAVADGLGGHGDGEVASEMTLRAITKSLEQTEPDAALIQTAVLRAIDKVNNELVERPGSAATTILVATVTAGQFRSYHAGDSELLLVGQRGKVKLHTVSHSPVGYAVEAGMIDAEQGFAHEDRHIISNCVGMVGMRVEIGSAIKMAQRDTLVLASDGLWDNLHVSEVAEIVRKGPLDVALAKIEEQCLMRMRGEDPAIAGKPDDLTVILYRPQ